jgi:hypothetical protein
MSLLKQHCFKGKIYYEQINPRTTEVTITLTKNWIGAATGTADSG